MDSLPRCARLRDHPPRISAFLLKPPSSPSPPPTQILRGGRRKPFLSRNARSLRTTNSCNPRGSILYRCGPEVVCRSFHEHMFFQASGILYYRGFMALAAGWDFPFEVFLSVVYVLAERTYPLRPMFSRGLFSFWSIYGFSKIHPLRRCAH